MHITNTPSSLKDSRVGICISNRICAALIAVIAVILSDAKISAQSLEQDAPPAVNLTPGTQVYETVETSVQSSEIIVSDTLSVTVNFKQNRTELLPDYINNAAELHKLAEAMQKPELKNCRIHIVGYASPEGPHLNNESLSRRRAERISQYLQDTYSIPAELITTDPIGVDWPGLVEALTLDKNVPMADEVLQIIATTSDYDADGHWTGTRTDHLKRLDGGRVWSYMLRNIYPYLRGASAMAIYNLRLPVLEHLTLGWDFGLPVTDNAVMVEDSIPAPAGIPAPAASHKSLYMSLHTNMLYDVIAIPNGGAEVYLGKNFSVMANYWNSWWKSEPANRFWRTYGLYLTGRYWFGRQAHAKPLTGHHAGIYAQAMLYDFEWGGTGYLSGIPGKNIFHQPTLSAGVEYGYALPIGRRLNIDFSIAIGYLWGQYQKYIPADGSYLWQSTNNRRWIGPTKIEVSLVWLLGSGNVNKGKGGSR